MSETVQFIIQIDIKYRKAFNLKHSKQINFAQYAGMPSSHKQVKHLRVEYHLQLTVSAASCGI